jgi:predicted Fe-Mo cluster-binding NifX family protein
MKAIKIAIGTSDGVSVCDHLARSSSFLIFDVEGGRVVSRSSRERGRDGCGNHASFVEMLEGCRAVLCGGIGTGAYDSLVAHGIQPVVTAGSHSAEEAAELYLADKLATTTERVCLCGPSHSD